MAKKDTTNDSILKINTTNLKKIVPPEEGYELKWDPDLTGFGVRVMASGKISFIYQGYIRGTSDEPRGTIGTFGVMTPAEARRIAKRKLADMSDGRDPRAEKLREKALSITLQEVGDSYVKNRRLKDGKPLKQRTKDDIKYHLRSTFSSWSSKPIVRITRDMVKRRYTERCEDSVAQASQAFRVLSGIFNYAIASYRDGDGAKIIADNPVDVLRESQMWREVAPRKNSVPLKEIGKWWSSLETMRNNPELTTASRTAADLIAVLALTGLRLGEARSIRWEQVSLEEHSLWLADTKNRTELLRLPLSNVVVDILKQRQNKRDHIFPARSGKGHLKDCRGQLELLAKETGITVTAHDLRRTFSAVAGKKEVELWRTKALMGHKQKHDVTLHHYKDLDDVRFLKPEADLIADYFEEQRRVFEADNVVNLERRA